MHYSLERYIQDHGKFPDEADPSGWLESLELCIDSIVLHSNYMARAEGKPERKMELPFKINLVALTDNPGFYAIKDETVDGIYPNTYPEPFKADSDEDAIKKLQVEIEKYNQVHSSLFAFGLLEKDNYGKNGLLSKVERNMPLIIQKNMSRHYIEEHCA